MSEEISGPARIVVSMEFQTESVEELEAAARAWWRAHHPQAPATEPRPAGEEFERAVVDAVLRLVMEDGAAPIGNDATLRSSTVEVEPC